MNCDRIKCDFEMGSPSRPFEQLMSVFPKQSAHAIPACYRHLLSDPSSPIIDFYPTSFRLDINGAAYAWMGVNLLPFICKKRLLKAMHEADNGYKNLSESERERNAVTGPIVLFFVKDSESESNLSRSGFTERADFKEKD